MEMRARRNSSGNTNVRITGFNSPTGSRHRPVLACTGHIVLFYFDEDVVTVCLRQFNQFEAGNRVVCQTRRQIQVIGCNEIVRKRAELRTISGSQGMERTKRNCALSSAEIHASWMESKWYVLFVRSNQEKRVAQHLLSRTIEHFLPVYESVRQWKDRKVRLLSPLFPGYVFVRLPLADRLKALIVPNVVNLVGTKNAPAVISEEELEWIKRGTTYGKAEPHPYIKAGDPVVIKVGPMAGMEGIFVQVQNNTRVLIRLDSIARAFAVEVDRNWVEATAPTTALKCAS